MTAALQMAGHGLAVLIHRDIQHKLHREQLLAISECPNIEVAMKEALLILKFQSAPWSTGIFGRRLKEAMTYIDSCPANHELIEIVKGGIIQDLGLDPMSSNEEVKAIISKHARGDCPGISGETAKMARWGSFVDGMHRLRKQWHLYLFWVLFALALEGKSPWAALASSLEMEGKGDELAIMPRVLRVSWQYIFFILDTKPTNWECI